MTSISCTILEGLVARLRSTERSTRALNEAEWDGFLDHVRSGCRPCQDAFDEWMELLAVSEGPQLAPSEVDAG